MLFLLKYNHQKHFEFFLAEYGMGMLSRHHDRVALMQNIFNAVDCDFSGSVKACNHCVSARFVGADFFALVKGEKRNAQCGILRKSFAHYLTCLISDLVFKTEDFSVIYIFITVRNSVLLFGYIIAHLTSENSFCLMNKAF